MLAFFFKRSFDLPDAVQEPAGEAIVPRFLIHTFKQKKDHLCKSLHSVVLINISKPNGLCFPNACGVS